ncbi:BZ3500_MvSof-1268-A1-R1_C045g00135 [Microbotryum saponariae]|uniref:BZ3500_MvSof-1268-A1-R1_C045g00135 protein n=1 Tax=Microbotryum saponariae TaxID=289078 RepID=A0A2X0L9G6_9BASI|nr:BZ3501_MvSof-1269-A2-R1_Chr11g03065 [Microbotryum saponariae]SDA04115.1 BZ3500_MvSof-1268-A1-R1_C045g00135 [Microbotryum saponariae]
MSPWVVPFHPGPEVVSSRKAERTASVSSFQILVLSGVSLLASAAPLINIDEPDRPVEPAIVRARNVIAWTLPSGRVLRCLIDSGSEVDLVDQEVVRVDPSFATARLTAPLHLRLGTQDKSDRCAVFATAPFSSGALDLGLRPFFICRVMAYDAILGLPFLKDTGMLVGWGAFTVARTGPSQPVAQDTHEWDRAVTVAPILSGSAIGCNHPGLLPDDEIIGLEPHNPLLDVVDDPTLDDMSESKARTRLAALLEKFSDVFVDSLPMDQLPPYQPVNHEIPLIDPTEKVKPRVYPLADKYRSQWAEHSAKYTRGRFWVSGPIDSAAPVFAIPKKNSQTARFVIDLRARNSNTVKGFSPIPDMTNVRYEVARSRYRSKFDVAAAFEQVRVIPVHVDRTGFATVTGTYTSRVMQFGDTNAPNTLNLLTSAMFQPCLPFAKIFFDDVHVHSDTRRAHLRHIKILLMTLRHYRFYLGSKKSEWFSKSLDSLGTIISDVGIEVDPAKWERIQQWPIPRNKTDVQRFLGTVNWMRDHLPHLSMILEPITALMAQSTSWHWNEREQQAFDTVKSLVPAILRPIDGAKVTSGEHKMYLFTDASRVGIGACLASGPNRSQAVPTRFFSTKFNGAQLNYHVTDKEFLAVVSACRAFEQHLIGYPFVIVTDHQALCTIKTQKLRQTPRHIRMCLELSRFDFEFEFIAGKNNTLADSLSRLWEVKEGSHEDQVKENELEDMFFDGEHHKFTTPGESLLEERPYTSPSHDRLPPVDCAFGPWGHGYDAGSPGSPHLAENIMDTVDSSIGRLSPPIAVNRVHAIAAAPANDPPIPVDADADELDLLGVATDDVNDTPVVLVSDRDPKFTSQFWRALQAKIGTVLRMSTAAHPETDGSSENRIKMVTQTLRIMVSSNHEAWASRLVEAEFALNSSVAVSTSLSAFEATYGYLPRCWPSDSWSVSDVPCAEVFARIRQLRNLDMTDVIIGAHLNHYVYLSTKNLAVPDGMKSKLLPRYIGPFRIRAAIPATSSYDLELPPAMSRVHSRFHARLLRPYVENYAERFPGCDPAVLFVEDVADAADNSVIPERIVRDWRNTRGARSFLVRWVGRNDTDDTWMSEQSLRLDHPSVLDAYFVHLDGSNRSLAAR